MMHTHRQSHTNKLTDTEAHTDTDTHSHTQTHTDTHRYTHRHTHTDTHTQCCPQAMQQVSFLHALISHPLTARLHNSFNPSFSITLCLSFLIAKCPHLCSLGAFSLDSLKCSSLMLSFLMLSFLMFLLASLPPLHLQASLLTPCKQGP
jgi:hypothetical protein